MPKSIIFLTRSLPDEAMLEIGSAFDLRQNAFDRPLTKNELKEGLLEADGLISMLSDPIDRETIEGAPRLKIIANYAVGYNNIDLAAARAKGIAVTNTPGVLTETTADLCWALLMATARRIPEADRWVKSGVWTGWAPTQVLGRDIYGKTLGIVGMGRIGQAVARRAAGFSMRVSYFSRTRQHELEKSLGLNDLPLQELLGSSDYLSLHLPLTEKTRHIIDKAALESMKPGAILINTARGPIVDEQALIAALKAGRIAGAGLDVFEDEPRISSELLQLDNVVTLPHIGSASFETRLEMGRLVYVNLCAFFSNKRPPNMVE